MQIKIARPIMKAATPSAESMRQRKQPWRKQYYTTAWKKCRRAYRAKHYQCQRCEAKGRVTATTEVHHIEFLSWGGSLIDWNNLLGVCDVCHAELHQLEKKSRLAYRDECKKLKVAAEMGVGVSESFE